MVTRYGIEHLPHALQERMPLALGRVEQVGLENVMILLT